VPLIGVGRICPTTNTMAVAMMTEYSAMTNTRIEHGNGEQIWRADLPH
jgi:hypothetical protein